MTIAEFPVRLQPLFRTNAVNEDVEIVPSGPFILNANNTAYSGSGRLFLKWLPSAKVRWVLEDYQPTIPPLMCGEATLKIPNIPDSIRAYITQANMSGGSSAMPPSVSGIVENGEGRKSNAPLKSIRFHLANFTEFIGRPVRDQAASSCEASRAVLEADGWRITVDGIHRNSRDRDQDPSEEGFIISHVGELMRADGHTFLVDEAKPLLDDLYWFFSFCRGKPTPAILPVGINDDGEHAWSEWGSWNVGRSAPNRNWYNDFSAEGLEKLFPGFMSRIHQPPWANSAKLAIYWYLEAGRIGNDSALILAQAAFELLAWTLFVEDQKIETPSKFDKVDAATKLRQLIEANHIPTAIDSRLGALVSLAGTNQWNDGPQALKGLRNAMVHPTLSNTSIFQGASARALFEASTLSLWYLELSLLHLFSYAGDYSNRLVISGWKGEEVQRVPWAL